MYKFCEKFTTPIELSEYLFFSGIEYSSYKRAMFECAKINGWKITREDLIPYEKFPYKPPKKKPRPEPSEKEIALEKTSMESGPKEILS